MTAEPTLKQSPGPTGEVTPWWRTRRRAVAAYVLLLACWTLALGMPNDTLQVVLWLWLGTVAWRIELEPRVHLDFARDWWPFVAALVVYFFTRGIVDNFDRPVAVAMPIDVDTAVFGQVPTVALQQAWCGDPCYASSEPRWYDALLTTVYASHFVTGLTIAAVLWVRNHDEFTRWMRRLVAISFGALAIYIAYPMAPPWWASEHGAIDAYVPRITGRGWDDLGLERINLLLGGVGNEVAAMPSLHAGIACLVALYGVQRLRSPWRWLLLAYPLLMGLALVYDGEHYVVDVVCGFALAGAVLVVCSAWERARAEHPAPSEVSSS